MIVISAFWAPQRPSTQIIRSLLYPSLLFGVLERSGQIFGHHTVRRPCNQFQHTADHRALGERQ